MLREALILVYCAAVGLCAAGILSTLYQWVTTKPVAFAMPKSTFVALAMALVTFAVVGPYIVARGAIKSWFVDHKPVTWLVGGVVVSVGWAACSGILVLDLALAVRHSLV